MAKKQVDGDGLDIPNRIKALPVKRTGPIALTLMILTYSGKIPFSKPSTVRLHLTGGINCGDGCSTR